MTIKEYITSEDTESALRFLLGASLPLLVSLVLGYNELGLFLFLGCTFVFGIDIPIALPKKLGFMLLSGGLSALLFLVFTQVKAYPLLNAVMLFGVLFVINFLSPFSSNFSIVALLLNLSVMIGLSLAATVPTLSDGLQKAGYLLLGASWYILYALLMHPLQRPRQLRRRLQDCLRLTADYFSMQDGLLHSDRPGDEVLLALTQKQGGILAAHQQIREVLLREPMNITNPETFMGRATHFLANLVDLLELATASVSSLEALPDSPEKEKAKPLLLTLNDSIAAQLLLLEGRLVAGEQAPSTRDHDDAAERALQELTLFLDDQKQSLRGLVQVAESYRLLRRVQRNAEQELRLLRNLRDTLDRREVRLDLPDEGLRRFALRDTIGWNYLRSHLSLQSGFFRYALRMALTATGAYFLAAALGLGNPSWALLTVLVILKPGFSLSRERLAHRTYGTLVGLAAGLAIYYLFRPGLILSLAIFLIAQFGAFSFVKRQYAVTTGFFTIFILFFYSYLQRGFMDAAYYRLLDTLLAAGLCWLAMRFVFPFWELQKLPGDVASALRANHDLLKNVLNQARTGESNVTEYKLYRKTAFLETDDLLSSYRLAQAETPRQTELLGNAQRIALLIYTQLSLITNLGLFLKRNPDYRRLDTRVNNSLQEAMNGIDSLLSQPYLDADEEAADDSEEMSRRQLEIEELLRTDSRQYLPRAYDLFWLESAHKLKVITHKLRKKLNQKPEVTSAD
ncbi:FUSC family protein [Persicitalea jodogahamensis]|uniref:Integral membrane protein YccS N-terminal domain-containing protein n=1 Tax=Persicitalea jodogahamensis TaxID=402147 RepID=A0A8J3D590_9BACT|nr:FUSC family protein [Persicitalea jodogahamensis]GHB55059.1 hypothetical protein GCM10007390_05250 [Persicitalea jodogahamensis]